MLCSKTILRFHTIQSVCIRLNDDWAVSIYSGHTWTRDIRITAYISPKRPQFAKHRISQNIYDTYIQNIFGVGSNIAQNHCSRINESHTCSVISTIHTNKIKKLFHNLVCIYPYFCPQYTPVLMLSLFNHIYLYLFIFTCIYPYIGVCAICFSIETAPLCKM